MTRAPDKPLSIAYVIQNVGIRLEQQTGDAIPVRYTWRGLRDHGHQVGLLMLEKGQVLCAEDVLQLERRQPAPTGITATAPYHLLESSVRRVQGMVNLPYLALFDSHRFYEACRRFLPGRQICHEHNGLLSVGAALACKRMGQPYVLTFSADPLLELELVGRPLRGLRAVAARRAASFTYQTAHRILCVSEPAQERLITHWGVEPRKICVLPNGVDIDLFSQACDPRALRARMNLGLAPVVMFVGGFELWHGVELLVEAFMSVVKACPEARLVLVGDGPARSTVEQQAAALGLGEQVLFPGLAPHSQIPEYLALADVVVIPYPKLPKELWFSPLKLYEYMAAGKAIVASRAGQIAQVIEHRKNGWLVESGNADELARGILALLADENLRMQLGQEARRQAVQRHSWDRYVEQLETIYYQVLQEARRGNHQH